MSTKLVIHPAGGLPPARTLITNFVQSLFSGLDMSYIYLIYIHTYIHTYTYIYIQVIKIRGTLARADAARLNVAMEQEMRTCLGVDPSNPATYEFVYDLADPKAFTLGGVQEMYYTHAQFEAREHEQMLKVRVWLNKIWDFMSDPNEAGSDTDAARSECLYLPEAELCYVDRWRHRLPKTLNPKP